MCMYFVSVAQALPVGALRPANANVLVGLSLEEVAGPESAITASFLSVEKKPLPIGYRARRRDMYVHTVNRTILLDLALSFIQPCCGGTGNRGESTTYTCRLYSTIHAPESHTYSHLTIWAEETGEGG